MKVCAHENLGPFQNVHFRADSIKQAVERFREDLEGVYGTLEGITERTGEDHAPALGVYPQCPDCDSQMNFHDYPLGLYRVGPRGGIQRMFG